MVVVLEVPEVEQQVDNEGRNSPLLGALACVLCEVATIHFIPQCAEVRPPIATFHPEDA